MSVNYQSHVYHDSRSVRALAGLEQLVPMMAALISAISVYSMITAIEDTDIG